MRLLLQGEPSHKDLDVYGGLELRFNANWAYYIEQNGHQAVFLPTSHISDAARDCDFVFDAPTYVCPDKPHFHNYFSPGAPECLKGHCPWPIMHPTAECYRDGVALDEGIPRMFAPLPYPDSLLPSETQEPFDRNLILWANKGSFTGDWGDHRPQASMANLRVLAKLAKEFSFQVMFGGAAFVDAEPFAEELSTLLPQIPHTNLDKIPWRQLVVLMSQAKLSIQPGGITGCVFESIFAKSLPVAPPGFGFFQDAVAETKLLASAQRVDEVEIEEVLRRLWTDKEYYYKIHAVFQEDFEVHRNPYEHWKKLETFMQDSSGPP